MQRYTLLTLASCPTIAGSPHLLTLPILLIWRTQMDIIDSDCIKNRGVGNYFPRPDYFPS
ncbi:MAG: hypothetical protein F6K65_23350 [Moorea sp. SIO3C2]|nr:hypothetical protein [Moorena sp. SIO3C2]